MIDTCSLYLPPPGADAVQEPQPVVSPLPEDKNSNSLTEKLVQLSRYGLWQTFTTSSEVFAQKGEKKKLTEHTTTLFSLITTIYHLCAQCKTCACEDAHKGDVVGRAEGRK